jgi:broad specificity phosphatase PhoE
MLPHHPIYFLRHGETDWIVAHGGVFWALQRLLGIAELTHLPNAVVARFEPPSEAGGSWQIKLV